MNEYLKELGSELSAMGTANKNCLTEAYNDLTIIGKCTMLPFLVLMLIILNIIVGLYYVFKPVFLYMEKQKYTARLDKTINNLLLKKKKV